MAAKPTALDSLAILDALLGKARAAGADAADAVLFENRSEHLSYRLGALEDAERSESQDLGLRVFVGKRQAIVSSTDILDSTLGTLVERAVAMARAAPEDPWCGLADPDRLARPPLPDLDLYDPTPVATDFLTEQVKRAEDAARAVPGITNSEGASAGWSASTTTLATTTGFAGRYESSSHSVSVSVLAGEGTGMERDYEFSSVRHLADLEDAAVIGREAGERTIRRLGPRKVKTAAVPVVFDPRVSRSLIGHLAGAINGQAVARGTSFLKGKLNQRIFPDTVRVIDDATVRRGLSSRPFDGEGVVVGPLDIIADGILSTWILDSATARQLGLATTGHARRGTSGPPAPGTSNLYMAPGSQTPAELMADIKSGFYVTELIGMGVNNVTGDYSRGASGFWIENGELAYPVSEITIAGNLLDMFAHLTPADDLVFRYGTDAPTVRVEGLTVAGS